MISLSNGKKRRRAHEADTPSSDREKNISRKRSASSKLRNTQERLKQLQKEAEALREAEAALSKELQEDHDTLFRAAVDQLCGRAKPKNLKWERLVALTAKWRYGDDDQSMGSQADLKRSLSFAACLRLARNVTWSQWTAIEKNPEHIKEVLRLCSETCHQELDTDWGPYRFCLARQAPGLVPAFLLGALVCFETCYTIGSEIMTDRQTGRSKHGVRQVLSRRRISPMPLSRLPEASTGIS